VRNLGRSRRKGLQVQEAEANNGYPEDDDPRGWPISPVEAVPPVRWPLSLLAGVCCGVAAIWAWVSSAPSWVTAVAVVTAAAWLVFAIVRQTLERGPRAEPGEAQNRGR
jgi:hypothetical protein